MHIADTGIAGVKQITLDIYRDGRGFFCERYSQEKFAALGFHESFVQDNHSRSQPGVVRGLHFQHQPMQGKLVGATRGRILDVAVDIRPASPTFAQYVAVELSAENGVLLWLPPGIAHGFCVLGDEEADVLYKTTATYNAAGEGGIRFDDASIAIDWPVQSPTLSDRDRALPTLEAMLPQLNEWFPA